MYTINKVCIIEDWRESSEHEDARRKKETFNIRLDEDSPKVSLQGFSSFIKHLKNSEEKFFAMKYAMW